MKTEQHQIASNFVLIPFCREEAFSTAEAAELMGLKERGARERAVPVCSAATKPTVTSDERVQKRRRAFRGL